MNTNPIKPHHENFTEANKGNKDQFFVNFVAFCKALLWTAIFVLPTFGASAGVVFTTLYSFTGTNDGRNPSAALVQGSDGNFYGTTGDRLYYGPYVGTNHGTVFKISADGGFTNLYSFTGGADGAGPNGLVEGRDGNFYGTTCYGGLTNYMAVAVVSPHFLHFCGFPF